MSYPTFPFSAIVGQPQLKRALLLCAVDPSLGGVLIRGDKGTAKSTAARALAEILPAILRVPGCAYNCAPHAPYADCACCNAAEHMAQASAVPFVTLPLGATEDRVLGTLDLQQALQGGARAFQPGLLAAAHRGILYIDEVNLLAGHLVDSLLDAAAMGVNSVQREGLSVTHPSRFTLIGTMNLEEGDLRPQLLDRFGLMVEVSAPRDKAVRAEVVRRRIAFEADPAQHALAWQSEQQTLREQLAQAQQLLPQIALPDTLLELISHLCCEFEVASLRADIVMHKAARASAALNARVQVTPEDVRSAAELVLPHRRRRKPFEQPGLDHERLDELMSQAARDDGGEPPSGSDARGDAPPPQAGGSGAQTDTPDAGIAAHEPPSSTDLEGQADQTQNDPAAGPDAQAPAHDESMAQGAAPAQVFGIAAANALPRHIAVAAPAPPQPGALAGRRSTALHAERGRVVRALADPQPTSLAIGATLRHAALRNPGAFEVSTADLHQQIRVGTHANLILLVVDASGSMAAQRRMEAVKGAVLTLLTDAYQQRDQVAVIAFRGDAATLLLAPTRSVELAQQGLSALPTGGRTPLPHALQLALETLQQAGPAAAQPLLVLLSDGRANVALAPDGDPWRESLALAQSLAERGVPALVLDTEAGFLRLGRAAQLAQALGAPCLSLEELSAENLALTIQSRTQLRLKDKI